MFELRAFKVRTTETIFMHHSYSFLLDNQLEVTILKKEVMVFNFDTPSRRDYIFREFVATTSAAATCECITL